MHQISKPKINYFHCAHGQITDSVLETGFICVIIKSYAKMTMPIVKCNHNWRINRMSVAITTASTATATTMSTITTVSSISIGIQTKARRLIHRIAWCHCIRRRIISQISMFRFMFDKLLFATLNSVPNISIPCNWNILIYSIFSTLRNLINLFLFIICIIFVIIIKCWIGRLQYNKNTDFVKRKM